jgi:CelD/BcsL family acetyltransferase involved in cellulose biosynthesis
MTLPVHPYHDANGFEDLAEEWNELLHRSTANTIFLTLEFQRTWWQTLGEGELLILAVRDDDGELIGIAPLFATTNPQGQRALATVGCVEVADYLDFIVARGRDEAVYTALVDYLTSPSAPTWDLLDLCNIHQDSPTLNILPALAEARGWTASTARDDVCPIVQLPGTWEEYLEMLEGKQRREIRRKLRRTGGETAQNWYIVGPEHDLETEVEEFLDLMAASAPDKADFLTPRMRDFFRQLARVVYDAGWLQLVFLKVGERKAAAYLNFIYDNRVLVYNSGLDWRTFPRLGAGIILTAHCIRHAIEQGRQVFDFMQGDERYKYQFGGQDVEVRRLLIRKT